MESTKLGKIASASFGHGGYQEACLGITIGLEGDSWGVGENKSVWDYNIIKRNEKYSKWSEKDRTKACADIMKYISNLLKEAKVHSIDDLVGIPVEVTFKSFKLENWRILTEVL